MRFWRKDCILLAGAVAVKSVCGLVRRMKEEKFKRIVIGATVAAVLLLFILVVFWIYQMIAVSVREKKINELEKEIARLEQVIEDSENDLLVYQSKLWLEQRVMELEMIKK